MLWSTPLKHLVLKFLFLAVLMTGGSAHAVICNVTATSVPLSTLYVNGTVVSITGGTISGSCQRETGDATRPYIYIGMNQGEPPAGRVMTRQNGTQTLTYEIYHRSNFSGIWTEGTGTAATSSTNGGVFYRMTNTAGAQAFSFPYYMRIPSQTGKPAGIYDDLAVTVTVRESNLLGSATGATLTATSFGVSASIQHSCYFSSSPTPLAINYTSFMATPATGTSNFQLSCTYNTPYTLTVGPPSTGTLLGIAYTLTPSAPSGTGTGGGQTFSVNGSAAAGQSGTCATATCTNSQAHTITVGF
jgi:spore coat protein U-like protein